MVKHVFESNKLNKKFRIDFVKLGISGTGVYDTEDLILKTEQFTSRSIAKKRMSKLIKKEGYIRHQGYIINLEEQIEIQSNF